MDMAQGMSQDQSSISKPVTNSSDTTISSAPVQSDERIFKQSDVNEIVKRAKHSAVEDYRRLQSEQPQYAQQKYGDAPQQAPSHVTPNEDHYRKIAAEEAQRLRDQWVQEATNKAEVDNAQRIVQNFWNKINPGREKYDDFDKVTGDIEYARFPKTVQLLADYIDNSHDVLYELGKDRFKMGQLEQLAVISPKDAIIQAQKLAQSIKDNDDARKFKIPNEPLSQMRPSNTGTGTNVLSMRDLKAKYRG